MIEHRSPVSGVDAFGSLYVATAGYDNQVILWDPMLKVSLSRACHDHLANQCRFSADGTLLVSASSDYTARVWSVPTLQIHSVLTGHDDDVEMAAFSPRGDRIATASRDHTVGVYETAGRRLRRLEGHTADVISVEWARRGTEIVSSSDDGTVRRWDPDGRLLETIDLGGIETDTVVFADNGILYVGNDSGDIVLLGGAAARRVHAHRAGIKRLVYEPSRRLLLSASYDRTFKLWSLADDGMPCEIRAAEVPAPVWLRTCAFLGRSSLVFGTFGSSYASYDLSTDEWDLSLVRDTPGVNAVHAGGDGVYSVGDSGTVFRDGSPAASMGSLCNFVGWFGDRAVTGGQLGMLFDASSGRVLHEHWSPLNCCAAFRRGGRPHLIVGAYTGEGLVFEQARGELELVATVKLHDNAVKGVACNDDHIFSVCATGAAAFFDVDTLSCVRAIPHGHDRIANGAAVLPDGRFASVSRDRKLRLWTLESCTEICTPHTHSVKCLAAHPSGRFIATGSYDGTVALYDWRRETWAYRGRPTAAGISSIAPGRAPDTFLASSYDGNVYHVPNGWLRPASALGARPLGQKL